MFGQCLVTPTILDSYEFAISAPPSWKSRAENGFLAKLRREKETYPAWVQRGNDFEDTVYRVCNAHYKLPIDTGSDLFKAVCTRCHGGMFQQKLKKLVKIDEHDVMFFGYSDVTFPNKTIDLKTTLNYKGQTKYLGGHQHLIYSWIRKVPEFEYVIVEWENEQTDKLKSVHIVEYTAPPADVLEKIIIDRVKAFFSFLEEQSLWLDYYTVFSKNK